MCKRNFRWDLKSNLCPPLVQCARVATLLRTSSTSVETMKARTVGRAVVAMGLGIFFIYRVSMFSVPCGACSEFSFVARVLRQFSVLSL